MVAQRQKEGNMTRIVRSGKRYRIGFSVCNTLPTLLAHHGMHDLRRKYGPSDNDSRL